MASSVTKMTGSSILRSSHTILEIAHEDMHILHGNSQSLFEVLSLINMLLVKETCFNPLPPFPSIKFLLIIVI